MRERSNGLHGHPYATFQHFCDESAVTKNFENAIDVTMLRSHGAKIPIEATGEVQPDFGVELSKQ